MKPKRGHAVAAQNEGPTWSPEPALVVAGILAVIVVLVMVYVAQDPPRRDVTDRVPATPVQPNELPSQPASPPSPRPLPRALAPVTQPREPSPSAPDSRDSEAVRNDVPSSPVARPEPGSREPQPPVAKAISSETERARPDPFEHILARSLSVDPFDDEVADGATAVPRGATIKDEPSQSGAVNPLEVRSRMPDKAKVAAKLKEIRNTFKAEYATRDSAALAAFAQRLAKDALESVHEPITAYALATEARDQSIQAGDYETFIAVGRLLTQEYGFDTNDDDITAFAKFQNVSGKSVEWYRGLLHEVDLRVSELCAQDDFDRALRFANVAKGIAMKGGDMASTQEWTARIRELTTLKTRFIAYKAAKEALVANPSDASANARWGTFLCLVKGDFSAGLPLLANGDDPILAALAKREARVGSDLAETVAVADEWYAYGEKSRAFRSQAWQHALALYQAAGLQGIGLDAVRIQKRIDEISRSVSPHGTVLNTMEKHLTAAPWNVRWERPVRQGGGFGFGGDNPDGEEWSRDETVVFFEGGRVESRYFDRFEIRNDGIELRVASDEGTPPFAGGPPGRQRDRTYYGRARLVGGELQIVYFRGDRMDDPKNRGTGTRQKPE